MNTKNFQDPNQFVADEIELVEYLLENQKVQISDRQTIPRRENSDESFLSFAQQRLWFLNQLEPSSFVYNVSAAFCLVGLLHTAVLEQSLNEIVRRHEVLRTTFKSHNGQSVQIVASTLTLKLPIVDLRSLLKSQQEVEVERLAAQEAQQPFDLAQGPLLRVTLLQLAETEHVVLFTMHHIVSDGWSVRVLIRELATLYKAFSRGNISPLSELPIQYADFVMWQRQWLQGEVLEAQQVYWQRQLRECPVLQLPTDHLRPVVQTFRGATQLFSLSYDLTEQLKTLSHQEGATLFMTLLAVFKILLHRYSGQDDIVVGSPIANRNRAEIEGLIGFFVNNLVLRTDLSSNPSFQELLGRVKEVAIGAYSHQDLPFEYLVEALQPDRNLSHNPLFQVTFNLENDLMDELKLPELTLKSLQRKNSTAKFDLSLSLRETHSGLVGTLEYGTDLFDTATITQMLGHFQILLKGIVTNPKQRVWELPLLTTTERHQQLVEWNNTESDYPRNACIHQLFEAQVEQTPNAVAIVYEDQQLTYRELNQRANQLARYLQSLGVKPEVLVGIYTGRSIEMIIGLLGILKSGGAYLPLDTECPLERLSLLLEETQISVLLTQEQLVEELPTSWAQVICLDSDWEMIAQQSKENLVSQVKPENLAYLMYTSGSTGQPKGVSVVHRGVVRLVKGNNYASLTAEEIFLQLAPVSFDASTFEIWGCLLNGAQLVVFSNHTPSLKELGQALQQYQITTLWLSAGLFHLMVDERVEDLRHIRQLLAGGDVLSTVHVSRVLQVLAKGKLINGYGPTENTTYTCCYCVTSENHSRVCVPIGRPIANTQIYLLDNYLQPVPVGVFGELYISGDGLARGYFNHPELTAEKFIPNPLSQKPGERLYKTGDIARYLPDSNL
ncbi:non-ribosomal peptide synthetase, partial [Scytonema sp. NUACC26]|uniref:non-ribosomal peptide synthetase n=1 Tax=Scytonema sp. NUACC26 TaxID=3140176 RepID=UPI0038B3905B